VQHCVKYEKTVGRQCPRKCRYNGKANMADDIQPDTDKPMRPTVAAKHQCIST